MQSSGMVIHKVVVSQFTKMLGNLQAILDETAKYADEKKFDVEDLLQFRLAPDQFNLMRQLQLACDTAKSGAAKLTDTEKSAPEHVDSEKTLSEIKVRIESVTSYLDGFSPEDFADSVEQRITQPRWKGKTLSGQEYLIQHVVPNFYFHITTAYAILRHNGVNIGKRSYLGAMPYREAT
jgi:hypothetical protein